MSSDRPFDLLVAGEINVDLILSGPRVRPEFGRARMRLHGQHRAFDRAALGVEDELADVEQSPLRLVVDYERGILGIVQRDGQRAAVDGSPRAAEVGRLGVVEVRAAVGFAAGMVVEGGPDLAPVESADLVMAVEAGQLGEILGGLGGPIPPVGTRLPVQLPAAGVERQEVEEPLAGHLPNL